MSLLTIDRTLAEIVLDQPAAAQVLEAFGLDYCCGGRQLLVEACAAADVDCSTVVASLLLVEPDEPEEWTDMCPLALMAHLERTHHRYLRDELPRLADLARKVEGAHVAKHPELAEVATVVEALQVDFERHLLEEERLLFPMIRELVAAETMPTFGCGSVAVPVTAALAEHDEVGRMLASLRCLTDGFVPPLDGCASYRALLVRLADLEADTHLHVHKENNRLLPAVLALEAELLA